MICFNPTRVAGDVKTKYLCGTRASLCRAACGLAELLPMRSTTNGGQTSCHYCNTCSQTCDSRSLGFSNVESRLMVLQISNVASYYCYIWTQARSLLHSDLCGQLQADTGSCSVLHKHRFNTFCLSPASNLSAHP